MSFKPRRFGIVPKLIQLKRTNVRSIRYVPNGQYIVMCRILPRAVAQMF